MYPVSRTTVSPINIMGTSSENTNVEHQQKMSGFDEIFNRTIGTLNGTGAGTGPDVSPENSHMEKKSLPKDEIQGIEAKEPLQPVHDNRAAQNTQNTPKNKEQAETDRQAVSKESREVAEPVKPHPGAESMAKVEPKKEKPAIREAAQKKDRDPLMQDMEKLLRDIDSAIHKITMRDNSSPLVRDIAKMKDDVNDALRGGKKENNIQKLLESLKEKISRLESDKTLTNDEKAHIAVLKTAVNDITKKYQPEREQRHAPAMNEAAAEKMSLLQKNPESKGSSAGDQRKGDERQSSQWNVTMLKSNFERAAEKATADKPAEITRFSAQLDTILDRARVVVRDSKNATFSLRLNPKELGALHINLGLEHGVLHGRFLVETPEAKVLLMQSIEQIRQELSQSGLSLGEFQVNVRGQREEFMGEARKKEKRPDIQLREISAEYATNTIMGHDGSINLVI